MAVKASERVKRYQNPNGPTISTVERKVIEQDGLYFKDIDGTGTVSAVNDWRLTPAERAEAYVKILTTSEKIGQIFTSDWRMGPKYPSPRLAANGHKPVADESGLLDEALRDRVHLYVLNFLKILCEKGTLRELPGCARAYRVRYNQAHGILEAAATTAVAMTEQQVKSLHEKLEKLTGKTIDLKTKVDPAVLGGIRLDIEGTELDGTVQNRLAALRRDIASVTL